jgi:hypothetical protein
MKTCKICDSVRQTLGHTNLLMALPRTTTFFFVSTAQNRYLLFFLILLSFPPSFFLVCGYVWTEQQYTILFLLSIKKYIYKADSRNESITNNIGQDHSVYII